VRHSGSVDTVRSGLVVLTQIGPLLSRSLNIEALARLADLVASCLDRHKEDTVVAQHGSAMWTFLRAKVLRAQFRKLA
jgi:hypothetical protein